MNHHPSIVAAFPGRSAKSIDLMMAGNVIRQAKGNILSFGGIDEAMSSVEEEDPSLSSVSGSTHGQVSQPGKKSKKSKKITADKLWSDHMLGDDTWAEGGEHSGQPIVYRWNGVSYDVVSATAGQTHAAAWFNDNHPEHAQMAKAKSSWEFFATMLRDKRRLPEGTNRVVIPCGDGYLEIMPDGRVMAMAPDRSLGMTYQIKIHCDTTHGQEHIVAPPPLTSRFLKWIETAHPDPGVRDLIQEQCGATLLPTNYQVASWWYGKAGCGKSTLAEICKAMQRNTASTRLNAVGGRFGGESLVGASLIMVDEVDADGKVDEGMLKTWISGNSVNVDRKNISAITYQSRAKWLICSNMAPFFKDKTDGIWRRICVVPWNVVVPEEDRIPDFQNVVLAEEGLHIFNWMLAGAVRLVQRGHFLPEARRPQLVKDVKSQARLDCDSVRAWVEDENVVPTTGAARRHQTKDQVFEAYEGWCVAAHRDVLGRHQFWKGLRGLVDVQEQKTRQAGGQIRRVYLTWGDTSDQLPASIVDIHVARHKAPEIPAASDGPDAFDQLISGGDIAF